MLKEACRYLGIQGEADTETLRLVSDCMETIQKVAAPKVRKRIFSVAEFESFMVGNDIAQHLRGCEKIMIFAATLGMDVDMLIKKMQTMDMGRAAALDACAAAYIEHICDGEMPPGATERFSPGYGDYPLTLQSALLGAVAAEKIGITMLESCMLLPSKSVTAVIGLR